MNFVGIRQFIFIGTFIASIWCAKSNAATVKLQPVADTSLAEIAPNNNFGGTEFFIAGSAGVSANGARNRALIRFDLSSIPTNSKVKSASMRLEVAHAPPDPAPSSFALHRILRPWGEGNQDSTTANSPGLGFAATNNEATWLSPFAFTTNLWTAPGATDDFSPIVSASTGVSGVGDFPFFNSTGMIADAQTWLDNPVANFGWLLKTEDEAIFFTARRFGSREFVGIDTNSPPYIVIEFIPPPIIFGTTIQGGEFKFLFLAEAGQNYNVQFRTALGSTNSWQTLTNIIAPVSSTNVSVSDPLSANTKFYRIFVP